jgi:tetratricopeptide (TPR) repeat protein
MLGSLSYFGPLRCPNSWVHYSLALDPKLAQAWYNKGNALVSLKHCGEALAAYDRALALDPNNTNAWYNKGAVLENLKRYAEASAAYERGFHSNDRHDLNGKSLCFRALSRLRRAAAERRAKELGD